MSRYTEKGKKTPRWRHVYGFSPFLYLAYITEFHWFVRLQYGPCACWWLPAWGKAAKCTWIMMMQVLTGARMGVGNWPELRGLPKRAEGAWSAGRVRVTAWEGDRGCPCCRGKCFIGKGQNERWKPDHRGPVPCWRGWASPWILWGATEGF